MRSSSQSGVALLTWSGPHTLSAAPWRLSPDLEAHSLYWKENSVDTEPGNLGSQTIADVRDVLHWVGVTE